MFNKISGKKLEKSLFMSIKSGTKSPAIILLSSFLIVVALTLVGPEESKSISNSASLDYNYYLFQEIQSQIII